MNRDRHHPICAGQLCAVRLVSGQPGPPLQRDAVARHLSESHAHAPWLLMLEFTNVLRTTPATLLSLALRIQKPGSGASRPGAPESGDGGGIHHHGPIKKPANGRPVASPAAAAAPCAEEPPDAFPPPLG